MAFVVPQEETAVAEGRAVVKKDLGQLSEQKEQTLIATNGNSINHVETVNTMVEAAAEADMDAVTIEAQEVKKFYR